MISILCEYLCHAKTAKAFKLCNQSHASSVSMLPHTHLSWIDMIVNKNWLYKLLFESSYKNIPLPVYPWPGRKHEHEINMHNADTVLDKAPGQEAFCTVMAFILDKHSLLL